MVLGRQVIGRLGEDGSPVLVPQEAVNTRTSLWPDRWPAVALQECIDRVEAADPRDQAEVKRNLPCQECPEKTRCLNAKSKELGSLLYGRELLTKPRSHESSLFPRELFAPMLDASLSMERTYWKPDWEHHLYSVCSGWDLAWSEKVGGDYLVKTTAVLNRRTLKRRLLEQRRWQGLTFPQQCALISSEHRKFNDDLVVLESDAMQKVYLQTLGETTDVPVMGHDMGNKQDLSEGMPSMLIEFDNRKWQFPFREDSYGYDQMQTLLSEFEAFGWVDGKLQGVGEHDDCVASFWHCSWGLKMLASGMIRERHVGMQSGRAT